MKSLLNLSLLVLPALVLLALAGYLVLGGLPGVTISGDQIAWLSELPFVTAWAMATLVAAFCAMQITGMNIENAERIALLERAAAGNRDAYRVVRLESICWFAMLALAALFFWPAR